MRTCWVVAEDFVSAAIEPSQLQNISPIWGSWRTWRQWGTDNVICHDVARARELVQRKFHESCNFYIPQKYFTELGRPVGVQLYEGNFPGDIDKPDDVVTVHLVAPNNELVLLLGFDLTETTVQDPYLKHKRLAFLRSIRSVIAQNANTQWVVIDHNGDLDPIFKDLSNLTCDKFQSVLQLLN